MFVTVARFSFPHEAHIARAQLEAAEIPAVIADEHTIGMDWLYSNALGGVRVQVPEAYAVAAMALLAEELSAAVVAEQGEDALLCPVCGSGETEFVVKGQRMAYIMMALTLGFWPIRRQIKCDRCGARSDFKG
ncbi:MAG: DUF2007 domain-containing protein [Gammaproteobacteria bacterium]|nr:DUF2007 domain-containing protein [Gammaproteobacteria bacterium]